MKTFVNSLLLCLFILWTATYVQSSGIDATSSSKTGIKYNRTKVDNKCGYTSANHVLNDENDFLFSVEDEDKESENEKRSSDARDILTTLLSSFTNSFIPCGRFSHYNRQIFLDNSPLYIAQRVLRI